LVSNTATPSIAVNSTPFIDDALVLSFFTSWNNAGLATASTYTSTPSKTWTEINETSRANGTDDPIVAAAFAVAGNTSEITAAGYTLTVAKGDHGCAVITITPPNSEVVNNALFEISPVFTPASITLTGNQASNALLEVSPITTDASAEVTTPTVWTPIIKT
jgi:hypothetical protein